MREAESKGYGSFPREDDREGSWLLERLEALGNQLWQNVTS